MRFRQFKLLMWKNYRWRRYFWIWTLIEALVPILIAIYVPYMFLMRPSSWNKSYSTKYSASYQPVNNKTLILQKSLIFDIIAYAPWNKDNQLTVERVVQELSQIPIEGNDDMNFKTLNITNFTSEDDLESFMLDRNLCCSCVGIVFEENSGDTFQYKLRLNDFSKTLQHCVVRDESTFSQHDVYVERGFAGIQLLLNEDYMSAQSVALNANQSKLTEFQGFPQPEYEILSIPRSGFITAASFSIIITSIALSIPFINAVIHEKENGVKELMKLHGVEDWIIWLSWAIHAFMIPAISLTVMSIIFKAPILTGGAELVHYVTFPVLWTLFMLYYLANISFVCLFCAIFHRGIVASFTFIIVMVANFLWITSYNELNLQRTEIFIALIPASSFAIAIETVQKYELLGAPFTLRCYFSIIYPVCALIFDTILYSILTLSVSSINPGKYGVSKSPFIFLKKLKRKLKLSKEAPELNNVTVKYVEQVPSQRKPIMQLKSLTKQLESTYAIGAVDLAIYEDEILVILGHKGAGKTTISSILAGLSPYDEGMLHYKERDLKENFDMFRTDLGICFQENRLFEFISIKDHLVFYAMLKGLSRKDAFREAIYNINILEMRENEKTKVDNVSWNTKKKLNLAISLLKRPKILILDEPTFGMDLLSKRRVWNILKNLRQNRTIILSTDFAKEAEVLADRIAIMQNGSLLTHGTQAYLEKTFGKGYELMISSEKNTAHAPFMELVKKFVPNALVTRDKQNEIVFKIQPKEIQKLAKLIKHLEENKNRLRILNMEVAYATLEQILLKIQDEALDAPKQLSAMTDKINIESYSNLQNAMYSKNMSSPNSNKFLSYSKFQIEKAFSLRKQQIKVLFAMKILYAKRTYLNALVKLGLPLFIFATVLLTTIRIKPKTEIDLSLETFVKPRILLKVDTIKNSGLPSVFSAYIETKGGVVEIYEENIIEKLIQIGEDDKILFGTSLLAAFEYEETKLKILYNHWELNALPIAINVYSNIFLEYADAPRRIININKPLPDISESQCGKKSEQTYRLAMLTLIYIFLAFYTVDLILYFFEFTNKEVAKKRMHLKMVSNVPSWIYWLTTFLFDYLFFIAVFFIRMLIMIYFSDMGLYFFPFSDFHRAFLLMIILFGISGLLCVYSMSFLFKTTKITYATFLVLNALCSISMYIFNRIEFTVLNGKGYIGFYIFYYPLKFVILFIPFLNFTLLLNKFLEIWKHNSACDDCESFMKSACEGTLTKLSVWNFPSKENPYGLSLGLLFLFFDIMLYAILLWLINMGYIEHWYNLFITFILRKEDDTYLGDNSDLNREIIQVQNMKKNKLEYDKSSLIADRLSKYHFKFFKLVPSVENISFITERGTCFGILGINGSGKTTVTKMLAAEISPAKGTVSVEGVELNTKKKEYISMIGYCPQTNPLFDEFTGKEILKFFGLLNGIKKEDIEMMANEWISAFGLERTQDKNYKTYSHSIKRKLSAAISFIGDPKVIILDEPTNGVDADTKIKFQEILMKSKESGKTVIISSVSVDECQKLCDRISILMNGEVHCIGTATHLKKRYAVGYSVSITIRGDISSSKSRLILEQNILSVFGHEHCHFKEEHRDLLYYHIKDPSLTWSDAFEKMETIKKNHNIIDNYILKNIDLKEVFTAFMEPEYTSSGIYVCYFKMELLGDKTLGKIKILLWKSYQSRKYFWMITLIEALVPILIAVYVTWVIATHQKQFFNLHPTTYTSVFSRQSVLLTTRSVNILAYSPDCKFVRHLLTNVETELNKISSDSSNIKFDLRAMKSNDELERFIINQTDKNAVIGLLFLGFNESNCEDARIPNSFIYKIRRDGAIDTRILYPIKDKAGPNPNKDYYLESGFAGFQLIMNEQYIQMKYPNWKRPNIEVQAFPYPEYESSPVPRDTLSMVICFSIIITFVSLSVPFINHVTEEKGNGTKALIMLHGVKEWIIWFTWFMHAVIVLAVSLTVMTVILKYPMSGEGTEPIRFVPFTILWLMLMLYCIATMSFSFMFCAIFHQGAFAAFTYFIVAAVEIFIDISLRWLDIHSFSLLFCIFPTTAFSKGFDMIRLYEEIGVTYPWQSLKTHSGHQNPVSLLISLIMLVVDIILYTFLTYYISAINPGKDGIKKSPLYFLESFIPFLRSNSKELSRDDTDWEENYEYIEPPSVDEISSVQIRDLCKEYGSFLAINGVDMDIYENEITVILGHNGAGKTTILKMLAGLILPDGGSIAYKDMDISENQNEFRQTLGVSFQEDRLFPYLSVMNHLLFYGMLKGYSWGEVTEQAENYLEKMEMYEERYLMMKNITVAMRRKLSLMISLMGDSKILLLDQPTFGMDIQSKVITWDFLMDIRQGRTIISTARDMHDAEKIASRIAIMESGVLVSYGTIAFLKKTFDAAYELSICTENGDYSDVANFVDSYIPNSTVKQETEEEILFKLQPSETSIFPDFFEDLENSRDRLGITNISLGYTSLEQMLLEIGSLSKTVSTGFENMDIISESQFVDPKEGISLVMLQLSTLFKKKFLYISRNYIYLLMRIVFPIVIALLAVKTIETYDFSAGPHLDLSMASYPNAIVMLNKHQKSKQFDPYYKYIEGKGAVVKKAVHDDFLENLLEYGRIRAIRFRKKLMAGFDVGRSFKIFYNPWLPHSLPIAITTLSNMMLIDASGRSDMKIETCSYPIPNVEVSCYVDSFAKQKYILTSLLFIIFTFFTVDILLYLFEFSNMEITSSLMHIQIISKVPTGLYWFTVFVFDFIFFIIIVAVRMAALKIIDDQFSFITFSSCFRIFLSIVLLFGVSGLLFIYVLSFLLRPSKETIIKLFVLNFVCSLSVLIYANYEEKILEQFKDFQFVLRVIETILSLVPFFNYNLLVIRFIEIWNKNTVCQLCATVLVSQCQSQLKPLPFLVFPSNDNPNGLLWIFMLLMFNIVLYSALFYFISSRFFAYLYNSISAIKRENEIEYANDDVRQELNNIKAIKERDSVYNEIPLLVNGLRKLHLKSFQSHDPVEEISFIAQNGTCFGILGVYGAGKSTILKMLTTEILPTSGDASIEGISLYSDKKQYISMIGYCPQSNPLMDELTGKEMLTMIASLRGISGPEAETLTNGWISFLKLEKYQNRYCGSYSNGNKRKLCTAIALIGNPKVIFLDEPTTDLDPVSTRRLHDIIKKCKESGLIVVLASPNMEECEILCDRITILIQGKMYCIGTLKDLKKLYAYGYGVTFKVHHDVTSMDETYALEDTMANAFGYKYCELIEEQRGLLRYHISDPSLSWSTLFRNLEEIKNNYPIVVEYIATNTTLNDVFITLSQSEITSDSSLFY